MEFNLKETFIKHNFIFSEDEYWDSYIRKFDDGYSMEFEVDKNMEEPIFTLTVHVPEHFRINCENAKNGDSIGDLTDYFEMPTSEKDILLLIAVGEQLKIHMVQYDEMKRHYFSTDFIEGG